VAARIAMAPMPFFARLVARKIAGKLQSGSVDPQLALHLGYAGNELARTGWFLGGGSAAGIQMSFPTEAAMARSDLGERLPHVAAFVERIVARWRVAAPARGAACRNGVGFTHMRAREPD
jgi:glutathione S-transferase